MRWPGVPGEQDQAGGVGATSGGTPPARRRVRLGAWGTRSLHLLALTSFTVGAPLFLVANPQFFIGRGLTGEDIVVIALAVTFGLPAVLLVAELLAGLVGDRLASSVHLTFVGLLAGLFGAQLLYPLELPTFVHAPIALGGGATAAWAYARRSAARSFVTALAPAPVVLLGYFLLVSPVAEFVAASEEGITLAEGSSRTPVVMVVLDELPGYALMDERRRVDAIRYPAFARLAADSIWFRNATTSRSDTELAVPSLVSGRHARFGSLPIAAHHERSVFPLFGSTHDVHASEPWTDLCPERLCPETSAVSMADRIGPILATIPSILSYLWLPDAEALGVPRPREGGTASRTGQFEAFTAEIEDTSRPTLHYLHVLFPHKPWRYLPSGDRYPDAVGLDSWLGGFESWGEDRLQVRQYYQRSLLQLGHVDRLLGGLLDRLRETGLYERSLIVVAADHGVSFRAGDERRDATETNAPDILSVPLFVKLPGQRRGRIDDRPARTVDVLPTIAEAAAVELPWPTDGRSLLSGSLPQRSVWIENESGGRIEMTPTEFRRRRDAALRRQIRLFGTERDSLYRIGPRLDLLGREAGHLTGQPVDAEATIVDGDDLHSYDPDSGYVPARIGGPLDGLPAGEALALVLDGRIAATTRSYQGDDAVEFAAMVPPETLKRGRSELELMAIVERGRRTLLRPLILRPLAPP